METGMNKLLELLAYLIDVDRGITNYDTQHLHKLLSEVRQEWGIPSEQ